MQQIFAKVGVEPAAAQGLLGQTRKLTVAGDGTCITGRNRWNMALIQPLANAVLMATGNTTGNTIGIVLPVENLKMPDNRAFSKITLNKPK